MKPHHLAELEALRASLQRHERERAAAAERQRAAHAAAEAEQRVFAEAVGPVQPLARGPAHHTRRRERHPPVPRQRLLDEQAALKATMSDAVDVESLLLTDDGLAFRRPGVGPDVVTRLRRGQWALQGELDLHGLRRDAARDALAKFLAEATQRGWRCLRIVHGKGHGSPGREPVLKAKVQRWLAQNEAVIAFTQATGHEGGAGALIVLLAGSR